MKKVLVIAIMIMSLFATSYCAENLDDEKYFIYNGFRQYDDEQTNKVSYSIKVEPDTPYNFELNYYYNEKFVDTCSKEISINDDEMFKKVTCEIQKLGDGEYIFDANLYSSQTDFQINIFEKAYIYRNSVAFIHFEDLDESTKITITVDGLHEKLQVQSYIPKEVIAYLDDSNKDELIESQLEYEILESDPLIAWNVQDTPTQINYTINKKITEEQRKQFKVEITQTKGFAFAKYIIFALIIIIIGLLIKPMLKKNAKKK